MKYVFLLAALGAVVGCSKKDDAKNNCCTDVNLKVTSSNANLTITPPNVITPNGDGINEQFRAVAFDKSSSQPNAQVVFATQTLKVYRSGASSPVYSSARYQGGFDGHDDQGAELPEGSYRYELTLDDNLVTGNLCIVRTQKLCTCRAIDPNDPLIGNCQ